MTFTFSWYESLLHLLKINGYEVSDYHNWHDKERCVILRHDVDEDLNKAVKMASVESSLGVKSTYFVLLSSDYYNVFSKESYDHMQEILNHGHEIGLHFDELRYPELKQNVELIKRKIVEECRVFGFALGKEITTVSMHRPSKMMLDADLQIPGIVNSYGIDLYKRFKYISDSRRRWREPVEDIVNSGEYQRLHILTHAFWYNNHEKNMQESLLSFINAGNLKRFLVMNQNFSDLQKEINIRQVLGGLSHGDQEDP